jgi:hypothetical protein
MINLKFLVQSVKWEMDNDGAAQQEEIVAAPIHCPHSNKEHFLYNPPVGSLQFVLTNPEFFGTIHRGMTLNVNIDSFEFDTDTSV